MAITRSLRKCSPGICLATTMMVVAAAMGCGNGRKSPVGKTPKERAAVKEGRTPAVNGERALEYVTEIVALGPRHPGAPGAEKTRSYILAKLQGFGLNPKRHDFQAFTPHPRFKTVKMANITVDIGGPGQSKVLIGGHFDGKILEGIDFKGANDGGSSTALLLELARVWSEAPPPLTIRIAFFDGEEAFVSWSDADSLYGSKRMAGEMRATGEYKSFRAAIVVDMIGDKNLQLVRETLSTPWLAKLLEGQGKALGFSKIFSGTRGAVEDDHLPFLQIGIPSALLIDLTFGPGWSSNSYWHTEQDTPDKLAPESFEAIGRIVLGSVREIAISANRSGNQ